jgi:hypothetical protein
MSDRTSSSMNRGLPSAGAEQLVEHPGVVAAAQGLEGHLLAAVAELPQRSLPDLP